MLYACSLFSCYVDYLFVFAVCVICVVCLNLIVWGCLLGGLAATNCVFVILLLYLLA